MKKMIQEKTKLENLAEELRVLYVAMTRAKEKLILTGSLKMGEDGLEPYVNHMTDRKSPLSLYQLESANRYHGLDSSGTSSGRRSQERRWFMWDSQNRKRRGSAFADSSPDF